MSEVPRSARPDRSAQVVVATYNIHSALGTDGHRDITRIAQVIASLEADVIALQEVDCHHENGRDVNQLDTLAQQLGLTAVAGPVLQRKTGPYGNGLLSALPLVVHEPLDLTVPPYQARGAIWATVHLGALPLRLVVTHLGLRPRERRTQWRRLLPIISGDNAPTLLMGDFNMWSLPRRPLHRAWPNEAAPPALRTYPSFLPLLALDRIYLRPAIALRDYRTIRTPLTARASDHLPLVATIDIPALTGERSLDEGDVLCRTLTSRH